MKRGTTPKLKFNIDMAPAEVSSINFVFKNLPFETGDVLLTKTYPTDICIAYSSSDKAYIMTLTAAETYEFPYDTVYCDVKITDTDGNIPDTSIVAFPVSHTMYAAPTSGGNA